MKFNNKLKLPQYIKLVDEIVEGYFEQTTGEYVPHIGEIHMAYLYFKNCAIAEDGDEVTPENIVHVQGELENALKESGCSAKSSMRVTLLFEELFMMIYEKNPGMVVLAECFIKPGEKI